MIGDTQVMNISLYEKLNFDFLRDITPVGGIALAPQVMVVNPAVPTKSVAEFIAHAKANPGRINMASSGYGVTNHVTGELFKLMTGIDIVHVPYRGGALAVTDLLGGQVQMAVRPPALASIHPSEPRPGAGWAPHAMGNGSMSDAGRAPFVKSYSKPLRRVASPELILRKVLSRSRAIRSRMIAQDFSWEMPRRCRSLTPLSMPRLRGLSGHASGPPRS
jgi:hypothetical protein